MPRKERKVALEAWSLRELVGSDTAMDLIVSFAGMVRVGTCADALEMACVLPGVSVQGVSKCGRLSARALAKDAHLRGLHAWTAPCVDGVLSSLGANAGLRSLTLDLRCGLDLKRTRLLAKGLESNRSLRKLHFPRTNKIDASDGVLAAALQRNAGLVDVDLRGCLPGLFCANFDGRPGVVPEWSHKLVAALLSRPGMRDLGLGSLGLCEDDAIPIAQALRAPGCALQSLDLEGNRLGGAIAHIAEALESNSSLRSLDLSANKLLAEDAAALARALERNNALRVLKLRFSLRKDGGCGGGILAALESNSALRELDLGLGALRSSDAAAFAQAVKSNKGLVSLTACNNYELGSAAGASDLLRDALAANSTLRSLNVEHCKFQDVLSTPSCTVLSFTRASLFRHNL